MASSLKNVVIIGAGGNLGSHVLKAFLSSKAFNITALTRESSTSSFPDGLQVIKSDYSHDSLVSAFKGQDAVISIVGNAGLSFQQKLIDAAVDAGVKRFIPSEFGNNTADDRVRALAPLLDGKKANVDYLKERQDRLTWTALITGPFFDAGVKNGFLGFNLQSHEATLYDEGTNPASVSTLAQIGRALVAVLQNPEVTQNQYVYVESFTITQKQILGALEKATGKDWKVTDVALKPLIEESTERLKGGDFTAVRVLLLAAGWARFPDGPYGDWARVSGGSWNERLGLEYEDFDEVVGSLVN
ncbi:isoflavone reductase family protein [Aspergillus eucalypticola CBS 122712]|uniref:Isoflavone reductase family protein n=1 Tax=Aspergillus eucalypticola (strain CBS 122712 / IBT 29274) TaxID=1448314 RepID=A0A317VE49_ASPEC|nr:isoflavone reductase family protein [Aspergillus eucalypticola CBS 122712]PWY72643.1 isoflavone reductase family protein [Aspergillus eucalypticola CBS 122712]